MDRFEILGKLARILSAATVSGSERVEAAELVEAVLLEVARQMERGEIPVEYGAARSAAYRIVKERRFESGYHFQLIARWNVAERITDPDRS